MSNASNLSNLANVLDDGTSGQVLTSQGSGVATFADAGGTGVTVHTNQAAMLTDAASADEGSLHYENANNKLYVKQSSGFFLLASITNTAPTVSDFTETTGGGSANTILDNGTFALTSGSNTVITLTATDPDLETLVYSATVTSGTASNVISSPSLPISNQGGNTFTLTPVTSGVGGTITIRFDVSDGNNVVNKTHSFSIVFQVVDSNHTTLLATATSIGGNSTIEDSSTANSGSGHSITVNGDTYAGTFSPYRSGGYSTYFDGSSGGLQIAADSSIAIHTDFTIECWFYLDSNTSSTQAIFSCDTGISSNGLCIQNNSGRNLILRYGGQTKLVDASNVFELERWYHIALTYDQSASTLTLYIDGQQYYQNTSISLGNTTTSYLTIGALGAGYTGYSHVGYIKDFRFSSEVVYTSNFSNPTESLSNTSATEVLTCHLPYISDASTNNHSITQNSTVSTKPFSPYDYSEYDAADHGGSVYFDGNGDVIYTPQDTAFNFGTGDFTFEAWVYPTLYTSNNWDTLFAIGNSTNTGGLLVGKSDTGSFVIRQYGTANVVATTNLPDLNAWTHIACVRSSGTSKLYYNGSEIATASDTTNYSSTTPFAHIGNSDHTTYSHYWSGYVSDVRFISGTAVYSGAFTPPTGPLTTTGGTYSDTTNVDTSITASNTKLLLSGTDASIIDKSQGSNLKLVGNTTGSTTQVKFSNTKSIYLDSSVNAVSFTSGYDDPSFNFGTGDWTIELWAYIQTLSGGRNLFSFLRAGTNETVPHLYTENTGLRYYVNNTNVITSTNVLTLNTWHHIALTRNGNDHKIFVDGTQVGSTWTSAQTYVQGRPVLGDYYASLNTLSNSNTLHGYVQDFRITNGLARYTANFTPPTAPLEG